MCRPQYQNLLIALSLSAGGLYAMTLPKGMASSDWSSITKEYQRHRHGAFPIDGGYRARNWEQQFVTRFDGRGFEVDSGRGELAVGAAARKLWFSRRRTGRGEARASVRPMWSGSAIGGTPASRNGSSITSDGLEHGFTIGSRPPWAQDRCCYTWPFSGACMERAPAAVFDSPMLLGAERITYAGLTVTDARGRKLHGAYGDGSRRPAD